MCSLSRRTVLFFAAAGLGLAALPCAAQEADDAPQLPPWEAWLQVQADELGAGWHTGWMNVNPMGARCYMVVFGENPQEEGTDWLYLADVERLRFRSLADVDNAKRPARLAEVAALPAEEWQSIPMSAVRAQDEAHGCQEWSDQVAENASTSSPGALADPERFEALLPETLPGSWEKDHFAARTSASENWGGATYLRDGGAYMQLELRHYAPAEWRQARNESNKDAAEEVPIGERTGFYDPTHRGMPTPVLSVYLSKNFAVRVVGPGEAPPEDLADVLRQVPLDDVVALAEGKPARPESSENPEAVDAKALAAFLPETVAGWKREALQTAAGSIPTGPTAASSSTLQPLLTFVPEVLMSLQSERFPELSGVSARYEGGGPQPMSVGIVDYGALPEALLAAYRKEAAAGGARAANYAVGAGEVPGYEGTGASDDAVPPHGVKALVGGRFEVVVFERPPEGVSSVADFEALPPEEIEAMLERARTVLQALDLKKLEALSSGTKSR